jgi:hypothetical protein
MVRLLGPRSQPSRGLHLDWAALGDSGRPSDCRDSRGRGPRGSVNAQRGDPKRNPSKKTIGTGRKPQPPDIKEAIARQASRTKGETDRASGTDHLAEGDDLLTGIATGGEVHGDARSCGVLADLIECRSMARRQAKSLARESPAPNPT